MLTLLALAAGCVDAASFLGLGQVMTAAMTGNTILLGLALGQADAEGTLRSTVALAGFVAGALLGAAIVERGPSGMIWMPRITAALALELVVLVILALAWHVLEGRPAGPIDYRHPLIAAAGIAMGIQSAAATRVGVPGVTTTYVTGTLTSMAARLVGWLRSSGAATDDRSRDGLPGSTRACGSPMAPEPCAPGRHTSGGPRSPSDRGLPASPARSGGDRRHCCCRSPSSPSSC
jgi:uncharacterized membrane protein YoaK (UPF0700 family)